MNDKTQNIVGMERLYERAMRLLTGDGCKTNPPKAFQLFRVCAQAGHSQSQYSLGIMLKNGSGVPKDAREAAMWLRKAALQGQVEAAYELGAMYRLGEGIKRNRVLALRYFIQASSEGCEDAQIQCHFVEGDLSLQQQKRALAIALRWRLRCEMERTLREMFDAQDFGPPDLDDEEPEDDPASVLRFPTPPQ